MAAVAMKGMICMLLLMWVLADMAPGGEAQLECGTVISYLHPCVYYVSNKGPLGGCCGGVRGLYTAARTTRDRRSVCNCLKGIARSHPDYDVSKAAALPRQCGVNVRSPISLSTDCTKVT